MRLITGAIRSTPSYWFPLLRNIYPPVILEVRLCLRSTASCKRAWGNSVIQENMPSSQQNRLRSRNPPLWQAEQLDSVSGCDRKLCVKLNRARSGYDRCADSLYKWSAAESLVCDYGTPNQTIIHIRDECFLRSYRGNQSDLMKADVTVLTWIRNLDIAI
ncbi:hypothetical protein Trydic_g17679 [Trypoxylus dichotomus]